MLSAAQEDGLWDTWTHIHSDNKRAFWSNIIIKIIIKKIKKLMIIIMMIVVN